MMGPMTARPWTRTGAAGTEGRSETERSLEDVSLLPALPALSTHRSHLCSLCALHHPHAAAPACAAGRE
jgi:hypothetical protein